eukprot:5357303-Amphidinium_carterae.2
MVLLASSRNSERIKTALLRSGLNRSLVAIEDLQSHPSPDTHLAHSVKDGCNAASHNVSLTFIGSQALEHLSFQMMFASKSSYWFWIGYASSEVDNHHYHARELNHCTVRR